MEQIEYRLLRNNDEFEPLYHYDVEEVEAAARKMCEFYIKDNTTYQVVSIAKEPRLTAIYVKEFSNNDQYKDEKNYVHVTLEIRKFVSKYESPLIKVLENTNHLEVLRHLQSDFIYIPMDGKKYLEYKLTATEIDEGRNTYVYYCQPTDVVVEYS